LCFIVKSISLSGCQSYISIDANLKGITLNSLKSLIRAKINYRT
jgi:hypothetical protein